MSRSCVSFIQATANTNSVNAALALNEAGLLSEVVTTLAHNPDGRVSRWLHSLPIQINKTLTQELSRRLWQPLPNTAIRTHSGRELIRLAITKTGVAQKLGLNSRSLIDWVYVALDEHVRDNHLFNVSGIYAYEDEAASTFEIAKKRGILCFYDLPSIFYRGRRELEREECEYYPELASLLQLVHEPTWKIERKEREVELADHIFVASSINKSALVSAGITAEKISIIPYGAPLDYFHPMFKPDNKFRALFVGGLSPHKGIHYLLNAWKDLQLTNAELLLVGENRFPKSWLHMYSDCFRYINSIPHIALNPYYSSASVFVFPSLMDGFGLVLLEAMTCGIPVITTQNTGGADFVTDSVDGFVIPIRDTDALKEKLEWCYRHPDDLAEMGRAARKKAETLTWVRYRQTLINKITAIMTRV